MNPFERIQNVFGQLNPQQRQQAAAQMMTPQQNQQQMMGLGPQVASPAQEAAQAAPQTGMFAKFNNHLQDNKSAMMAMSAGMMGSPGQPGSIGQGFQNYAAGGQLDEQRRDKAQSKTATEKYLENMTDENGQPRYNPEQIGALVSNPMLLKAELAKKPATLKLETFYDDAGGSYKGTLDAGSGEITRYGGTKPASGVSFSMDENGNPVFTQGPGALTKTGDKKVEDQQLDTVAMRERMIAIKAATKPEYLTVPYQLSQAWSTFKDKGGMGLGEAETQELSDYVSWRASTMRSVNQYISDMTGTAMGEKEAARLMATIPNLDASPIEFNALINNVMDEAERALNLYETQRRVGPNPTQEDLAHYTDAQLQAAKAALERGAQ